MRQLLFSVGAPRGAMSVSLEKQIKGPVARNRAQALFLYAKIS